MAGGTLWLAETALITENRIFLKFNKFYVMGRIFKIQMDLSYLKLTFFHTKIFRERVVPLRNYSINLNTFRCRYISENSVS